MVALGAGSLGCAALGAVLGSATQRSPWFAVPFAVLLATSGYFVVRYRYRDDIDAWDLSESALTVAVFVLAPPLVVAVTAVGQAVAELARRNAGIKAAFNIAQLAFSAGVATLVFAALGGVVPAIAALVIAMAAMSVANQAAFTIVLAIAQERPLREVLEERLQAVATWVLGWVVSLSLGLLFLAAFETSPATLVLFFVPLALLYWAGRGVATEWKNRQRLAALHEATHVLVEAFDPREAIGSFLQSVRACFDAEAADLVDTEKGIVYRAVEGDVRQTELSEWPGSLTALEHAERISPETRGFRAVLESGHWRDGIAAPVRDRERVIGALVSYNRGGLEGFEEGELAMLEALASEAASAIQKSRLLNEVLDERSKLGDIVGSTSDGIFSVAADGAITSWNTAMEKITGHAVDEMVGTAHLSVLRTRDSDGNDVLLEGWSLGNELPTEIQVTTKTGAVRWLDCSYSRTGGSEQSLIVVARDTTATRELDQMRREFIATASHELRTPIAPIKGFAHLLLTKADQISDVERRTGLEVILRQAQRLERLAENVLSVSRIDGVEQAATLKNLDVDEVVSRTVAEFRATWTDRDFNVDAESVSGFGNVVWLEQILANLLSNAVRYSPAGSAIDVAVRARGDRVEVSVGDRGPGIPDDAIERIFDRFVRLDRDDTQAGSGLGLYIARQLAERMDGSLCVANRAGGGAEFRLSLPAQSAGVIVG